MIERIHEALVEICAVARQDLAAAAGGAVLFLKTLSPAPDQIDSSSGSVGNATYAAVEELVPPICSALVDTAVRKKRLDRLFEAIQEDDPPYTELLGEHRAIFARLRVASPPGSCPERAKARC